MKCIAVIAAVLAAFVAMAMPGSEAKDLREAESAFLYRAAVLPAAVYPYGYAATYRYAVPQYAVSQYAADPQLAGVLAEGAYMPGYP